LGFAQGSKGGTLALQVDAQGNVRYDAIAQYGRKDGQTVHSSAKGEFDAIAIPNTTPSDVLASLLPLDRTFNQTWYRWPNETTSKTNPSNVLP
jgi:hypothetical protein